MVSARTFSRSGRHNWIVRHLRDARLAANAVVRGVSGPRLIRNVTANGHFIGEAAETLEAIKQSLTESGRLYRQGNSVVFALSGHLAGGASATRPIVVDGVVTKTAPAIVGNIVLCQENRTNSTGRGGKVDVPAEYPVQFAVPPAVLQQVASMDTFMAEIPEARFIFGHPVFDEDFHLLDVGYHESQRILVCGQSFNPVELPLPSPGLAPPATVREVLDRLPPRIREWTAGFHWSSPVDLINYLAGPLMTVLMPMFVEAGHPAIMFWGNKPSIGKSLAAQCLAILKDGEKAVPTALDAGNREIENQIASELNNGRTTLFFDNAKGRINSATLEASITDAQLGFRGFHVQSKTRRPNDVLWLFTTNDGQPSDDLLSRCIHVRLHYEGEPDNHRFARTEDQVTAFVKEHRAEILAEAAGMVRAWLDTGRQRPHTPGRFMKFSNIVGGILAANGLPGFLSNTRDEVRQHSPTHLQLIALGERLIDGRDRAFVSEAEGEIAGADDEFKRRRPEHPREQKDWIPYLTSAGVIPAAGMTPEKQKAAATQYLKGVVKEPFEVDLGERSVKAMIVSRPLGRRRTAYALAVSGLAAAVAALAAGSAAESTSTATAESGSAAAHPGNADGLPDSAGYGAGREEACGGDGAVTGMESRAEIRAEVEESDDPDDDLWGLGQG